MPSKTVKKPVDPDAATLALMRRIHDEIDALPPEEVEKLHPEDQRARLLRLEIRALVDEAIDRLPFIRLGAPEARP